MRTNGALARLGLAALTVCLAGTIGIAAQEQSPVQTAAAPPLPLEPQRQHGESVTPAYEGWFQNADGSFTLLVGYYNRNRQQTFDIPVGPNNKVEPGAVDQGQPTHFEIGRQWGVFSIKVPKDFGNRTVTWTLVTNGEKQSIPFSLNKGYPISPYKEIAMKNEPPTLAFSAGGTKFNGPPLATATNLTGKVGQPVAISVWVDDVKSPLAEPAGSRGGATIVATLSLHKFRGPGNVTFDRVRIPVTREGEQVTANATFSAPGDYLLRAQANDESGEGGGGFQCCWTNTYVRVVIQ